ncbi:MAG: TIGR03620 family F420-dependent LLM class oxidoreductase [Solirubrobacteraceae bacterium]|nr:TIGR03620 family F420-dependent LLM class oxidoreductase [Solirubrobacteraceae bacterium]
MSDLRDRIGRVGVWSGLLGSSAAADERAAAAEIERLGFGAIWYSETPTGKEALVHAGLLLAATERVLVASGIANVYARDAIAAATGAAALAEAHGGRFVLGLGVSHAPAVSVRGHDYGRPVATMRAYLDAMEAAQPSFPAPPEPVPVVLAALRRRMLELAAERTAGAHPYLTTPEHTERARAILGPGPLLAPEQMVLLETDPARARETARRSVRYYLELPNYVASLRELGFGDEDLTGGGSDRLIDALVAWGDEAAIAARVRDHLDAGADHVCVQPLDASLAGQLGQLRRLAGRLLAA